jgi:hypothetical protein
MFKRVRWVRWVRQCRILINLNWVHRISNLANLANLANPANLGNPANPANPANLVFFLLLPCFLPAQGPLDGYLKGRGVLAVAPSFSFVRADRFDGAGPVTYDLPYRGNMIGLFAEYGLNERIDVVGTGAYVFTSSQSGLQDGGLYLKYRPWYRSWSDGSRFGLLLGGGASFPLTDYEPVATGALGQKAVVLPLRLIGQWETRWGVFFNLTGGYNWRVDRLRAADVARVRQQRPDYVPVQPSSFTTVLLKTGFPARHYYFDAWIEWQYTRSGVDYAPNVVDLPQAYGVSYTQVGGTAYYSENNRQGFTLSGGMILKGRNTGRLLRVTVGMVFQL